MEFACCYPSEVEIDIEAGTMSGHCKGRHLATLNVTSSTKPSRNVTFINEGHSLWCTRLGIDDFAEAFMHATELFPCLSQDHARLMS